MHQSCFLRSWISSLVARPSSSTTSLKASLRLVLILASSSSPRVLRLSKNVLASSLESLPFSSSFSSSFSTRSFKAPPRQFRYKIDFVTYLLLRYFKYYNTFSVFFIGARCCFIALHVRVNKVGICRALVILSDVE